MINYTYNINSITKKTINDIEDVVFNVVWEKVGVDENGNRGVFKLATEFDTSEVGINTAFVAYDNLTKETVIGWIESVNNEDDVQENILEQIQKSSDNETQVYQFPWTVVQSTPVEESAEEPAEEETFVYYNQFWNALVADPIYQTIKSQASQSLSVNVAYTDFSISFLNALADIPNESTLQTSINNLVNSLTLTDTEYNSFQTLLEVGNMNTVYTLPAQ